MAAANTFVNDGSFMAMFLASQGSSGGNEQTQQAEAVAEPSGGARGGSSSSTVPAATTTAGAAAAAAAAVERKKRRRFTETADEDSSSTTATSDVVSTTISSAIDDQESRRPEGDELVTSSWGKKYKAGFVPKSSHVGNLLPEDELAKYTSALPWNQGKKKEEAKPEEPVIDESNVGHKLLAKMGWKAGKGLGANENGKIAPVAEEAGVGERSGVAAGDMGGVGAKHTWSLEGDEDMFEQYRKRMMLGYRHRPNPNGNPRKLYY